MMKPTKERAIELIQKALNAIPGMIDINYRSPESYTWRRSTRIAIAEIFGENSAEVREFDDIRYPVANPTAPPWMQSRNEMIAQREYQYNLNQTAGLLTSMIDQIGMTDWTTTRGTAATVGSEGSDLVATDHVFVVHGRNQKARDALFTYLRVIGLHPLEWNEAVQATGKPNPYIGEILDTAFSQAGAVVVLMTPDDEARLREQFRSPNDPPHETELTGQARPNVLFEAGMAMGRNPYRTILIELGSLRPFTDVAGLHLIRMDNSSQRRQELAQRLESVGCPVNLDGIDWHTAGDFGAALSETSDVQLT